MLYGLLAVFLLTVVLQEHETHKFKRQRRELSNNPLNEQFPWHILLKRTEPSTNSICGGSLISNNWVLTAAKCLQNSVSIFLMFGTKTLHNSAALNMTSDSLYISTEENVGLIKLPIPVNFTAEIHSIALPMHGFRYRPYEIVETCGFGAEGDKWILQETLNLKNIKLRLQIIYECQSDDKRKFLCAQREQPTAAICEGDLGGALINRNAHGIMQIGIITDIPEFCDWPEPMLFLQTAEVLEWILALTDIEV